MLAHHVHFSTEALQRIVFKIDRGPARSIALPVSDVRAGPEQPYPRQRVNLRSLTAHLHQFVSLAVKHLFQRLEREHALGQHGLGVNQFGLTLLKLRRAQLSGLAEPSFCDLGGETHLHLDVRTESND